MKSAFLIILMLSLVACSQKDERYSSSLVDDLSGVWVYPSEGIGDTTILVVQGHRWVSYFYQADRISTDPGDKYYDAGEILGQEGVYYFANPTNFYSPRFLIHAPNGNQFMIISRVNYDRYKETGVTEVAVIIRVADALNAERPPVRPSIKALGVAYHNRFAPEK